MAKAGASTATGGTQLDSDDEDDDGGQICGAEISALPTSALNR